MELQNKAQQLTNESQEIINNYQNGRYDYYLTDPVALAISDLVTGYRTPADIDKKAMSDFNAGAISSEQFDAIVDAIYDHGKGKVPFYFDNNTGHRWKPSNGSVRIPLTIRRMYDIDRMQMKAQEQFNKTQELENFLRSYNNAVLPPPGSQRAVNTIQPWLSITGDAINTASQFLPAGSAAKAAKFIKKGVKQ